MFKVTAAGVLLILTLAVSVAFCIEPLPSCNPYVLGTCGLSTLSDDPSGTYLIPVAGEGGISTSTCYIYGMSQLNQYEVASIVDYQGNSMYAAWQALDADDYTRQDIRFGVRYSYRFFRLGVGYRVMFDDIEGYGSDKDDRISAGLRIIQNDSRLDIGSLHKIPFEENENYFSGNFSFTVGQVVDQNLELAAGLEISEKQISNYKLGSTFALNQYVKALASWESEPGRFGFGAIVRIGWLHLSYALQTHPELDWTHSIGISAMFP